MDQNARLETVAAATFPIAIQARLKHGMLAAVLTSRNWNQKQAAEFIGVSPSRFGSWINLKAKPRRLTQEQITKLYELTASSLDELWPETVFTPDFLAAPKTLRAMREVPVHLLASYGLIRALPPRPDEEFELIEMKEALREALGQLSPQQRRVLESRFLDGQYLEEIARNLGVCKERVRQIENKALRLLRRPLSKNKRLRGMVK